MEAKEYIEKKGLLNEDDTEIVGIIWYDKHVDAEDKLNISFELFERSPAYGICMELKMAYNELTANYKTIFWSKYLFYLQSEDKEQKEQIKYSLWVDFFEDSDTVNEAWSCLVEGNDDVDVLRELLLISGPVPFDKKDQLYLKLIADKKNHEAIFESLFGSFFDVYGQLNFQRARVLLPELKVDRTTKNYRDLVEGLRQYNSKEEYWEAVMTKRKAN